MCEKYFVERQCGSDPNDQRRTRPKPKARLKNAQASNFQWKGGPMERVEFRDEKLHVSVAYARSTVTDRMCSTCI